MTDREQRLLPPDTPESAKRRAALAQSWLSEGDVLTRFGIEPNTLDEWRQRRQVLAVWHAPENRFVYPPFQFNDEGPLGEMAPLLDYLNQSVGTTGWAEIEWLYTHHALLDGDSPADVLTHDPRRVLDAAHQEFTEDPDAGW